MSASLPQDPIPLRSVNEVDREILTSLIETKAINFEALGRTIGAVGANSVFTDDGWIRWCGSDLRIYRWPGPPRQLEDLAGLRNVLREVAGGR
jgi:hypothetical protein